MIINGIDFDRRLTCLKIEMQLKIERTFREEEKAQEQQERNERIDRLIESVNCMLHNPRYLSNYFL